MIPNTTPPTPLTSLKALGGSKLGSIKILRIIYVCTEFKTEQRWETTLFGWLHLANVFGCRFMSSATADRTTGRRQVALGGAGAFPAPRGNAAGATPWLSTEEEPEPGPPSHGALPVPA